MWSSTLQLHRHYGSNSNSQQDLEGSGMDRSSITRGKGGALKVLLSAGDFWGSS